LFSIVSLPTHNLVFYYLFILWKKGHGVCCQQKKSCFLWLIFSTDRSTWCPLPKQKCVFYGVCCQHKNLVFSITCLFYGHKYRWTLPTQTLVFYDLFILWTGVHGFCCQHKQLVFCDLLILWTGVHGVCCQHKNRGCGQTTAARVQYEKYYVSVSIIKKFWGKI
jgi:hypothetical protein